MDYKQKLFTAICEKQIAQKEIAERAGLSENTLSKIWLDKCKPKKKTVISLEKALDELLEEM